MNPSTWADAFTVARSTAARLPEETVGLAAAIGRVLARDLQAPHDVPHFASSAMDGWAISGDGPWRVVLGARRLEQGEATPIVTGGLLPHGTDAVLRSESGFTSPVDTDTPALHTSVPPAPLLSVGPAAAAGEPRAGQHMRPGGDEARAGDIVIAASTRLNPAHIALAAACSLDVLPVIRNPRVAFVFTGDEVDESGTPASGRVRDSFGPQLPETIRMLGGTPLESRRSADTLESTTAALAASALTADVVITTGGTGHSNVDHLRAALARLGATVIVNGVLMRPGGPSILAVLPNGVFVVCLPGNPLAAMMGLLTLAAPLLARLSGRHDDGRDNEGRDDEGHESGTSRAAPLARASVSTPLAGRAGTTLLLPGTVRGGIATPNSWHGSGMMRGLADADAILVVPEHGVATGERVELLSLPWTRLD
ncbi:molybdopterin-binding protein [Subtercola frigoramans]